MGLKRSARSGLHIARMTVKIFASYWELPASSGVWTPEMLPGRAHQSQWTSLRAHFIPTRAAGTGVKRASSCDCSSSKGETWGRWRILSSEAGLYHPRVRRSLRYRETHPKKSPTVSEKKPRCDRASCRDTWKAICSACILSMCRDGDWLAQHHVSLPHAQGQVPTAASWRTIPSHRIMRTDTRANQTAWLRCSVEAERQTVHAYLFERRPSTSRGMRCISANPFCHRLAPFTDPQGARE